MPAPNYLPLAPIRNLVLKGGGVRGVAYVGALEELDRFGVLEGVERVAGASAGGITAVLLGLGYSVEEIKEIVENEVDFAMLLDKDNPFWSEYSIVGNALN